MAIGLMQALAIPISIFPFSYRNIRSGRNLYRPYFEPWRDDDLFKSVWREVWDASTSLEDAAYMLFSFARMASGNRGEVWECGVYKGATARLLTAACSPKQTIRLFDTFSGIPEERPDMDGYKTSSFGDTSIEFVKARLGGRANIHFHAGIIPRTFDGLDSSILSFAHVDVDQYQTTKECCQFIFPRLIPGGIIVIDDYGRPRTPGSKTAVDEFLGAMSLRPAILNTGQAVIVKV